MVKILERINGIVWGAPALVLILGVGLFLSIRAGFPQIALFPRALGAFFRKFRGGKAENGSVTPFQALCTALAATVGTGNLAGVAGAMAIGGPGTIFWMWICALLGMATKFAEATLAVRFRVRENGEYVGGPMYIIREGLGRKWLWLAGLYSFFGIAAAFGVGNATQINAVVTGVNEAVKSFGGRETAAGNLVMGIVLAVTVAAMLLGGARRIGLVAEKLVPFAAAGYLLLGLGVLILKAPLLPAAMTAILRGAFTPRAVTGGVIGSFFTALRIGVSRGVFTNEAGMGTASIAHAAAQVTHPAEQGLMGIMEVFWDTIVICTMTALVILVSGVPIPYGTDVGTALTSAAFSSVYGDWVSVVIAGALCCFAFATVLGWGLYGARCAQFLFGANTWKKFVLLQAITVVLGAVLKTGTVWLLSETVNGLMAIPNLIALAALSPELVRLTKEYQYTLARSRANGGTNESFHQRQSLRAVSHAQVPPAGHSGTEAGEEDLPSEHRSAGHQDSSGLL
ncbi:MAG: sodium:alanine symporter family protein [Firmicutes bacterium]|nr:sodium:alanine symporter family protein [Bacillota bacterium]